MLSISEIKQGTILKYENEPYRVLSVNHSKQARSGAVLQTKMKNLITGQVLEKNFKQADKLEEAEIERKRANFLYKAGEKFYFMDEKDYDQFFLEKEVVGESEKFLIESVAVNILYFDEQAIGISLPPKIDLKVVEAPEGVKGDTAGTATKTVKLETGYKLNVPMFINEGEKIKINTETGEYVERA